VFNYILVCGVRPRKFVVSGQTGITESRLPEVHVLGGLQHVINVQGPCGFDVGTSEHGAQLENIRAEALHVIPFLLDRDGKEWECEHSCLASSLGKFGRVVGLGGVSNSRMGPCSICSRTASHISQCLDCLQSFILCTNSKTPPSIELYIFSYATASSLSHCRTD